MISFVYINLCLYIYSLATSTKTVHLLISSVWRLDTTTCITDPTKFIIPWYTFQSISSWGSHGLAVVCPIDFPLFQITWKQRDRWNIKQYYFLIKISKSTYTRKEVPFQFFFSRKKNYTKSVKFRKINFCPSLLCRKV